MGGTLRQQYGLDAFTSPTVLPGHIAPCRLSSLPAIDHNSLIRGGRGSPSVPSFPPRSESGPPLGTRDERLFKWLLTRFERVFFVAGNHEPYANTLVRD